MNNTDIINQEIISSENEIYEMLDALLEPRDKDWWDNFYADKNKPIPFFTNAPDENLVEYVENQRIISGNVLEIGCGNGRNAIYLAQNGFKVHAIDFSHQAIDWAKKQSSDINFECVSVFDLKDTEQKYDVIYDSGCLHHIKPHRRIQYLQIIHNLLNDNGNFGLVCFNPKGGANISDYDVYRDFSMKGGLAFTTEKLESVLHPFFNILEIREMKESENQKLFGKDFLWAILLEKR